MNFSKILHEKWILLFILILLTIQVSNSQRSYGPYGRITDDYEDYVKNDVEFDVDQNLLQNHRINDNIRRFVRTSSGIQRQGYMTDYDYNIRRNGGGGGGGHSGGGGGGYGQMSGGMFGGIDLYSILALAIFATFLGYVVFYYISVNGGGRSFSASILPDHLPQLTTQVFDAFERWAVLDFISKTNSKNDSPESEKDTQQILLNKSL